MKNHFLSLAFILVCCLLVPNHTEATTLPDLPKSLEKIANLVRNIDTIRSGLDQLNHWINDLLGGRQPSTSLRCRQPDETIRTVTRHIEELKASAVLDPKEARYKSAVTKESPQSLWKQDAEKLIAYNLDLRKQLKMMKQVEDELERVIREGKRVQTAAEVVSSSHKRLEAKIQAARQIETMMKDSFGCAWKDLERGLLVNVKELITQAERKKREFADAQAAQERTLKEHTALLLTGFRKHGLSAPSEIR